MADAVADTLLGPEDHGRRMSLAEFRDAPVRPGHTYELARGVIQVVDIPRGPHLRVLLALDAMFRRYMQERGAVVSAYLSGADSKVELPAASSERHPDRCVYTTPLPPDDYPWDRWTPAIVVEVVSPGTDARQRDYVEKRDEYLAAGILEYWIIDPQERAMLALARHGDSWREHKLAADGVWTTHLLPGFELHLDRIVPAR